MEKVAETDVAAPRLAILFWFYKDLDTCENRLLHLRRLNRGVPIFALYGGGPAGEDEARRRLGRFVDDFYTFQEAQSPEWKWQHGDRLIAAWHRDRGHTLDWDTVVIIQWDMLILEPIGKAFASLQRDHVLFSGRRPEREVNRWWGWVKDDDPRKAQDFAAFRERIRRDYGYSGEIWCCLFIVACLPRCFLDRYVAAGPPLEGFLEYKMPTMAEIFGIPACTDHAYDPWWASNPATRGAPARQRVLNAVGQDVPFDIVLEVAAARAEQKIIHPFRRPIPWWLMWRPAAQLMVWIRKTINAKRGHYELS